MTSTVFFACASGAKVEVRRSDDPSLPPPVVAEPTVRETVWAADSQDTVDIIGEELSKDRDVQIGDDGSVHAVDPEGYGIGFAVTGRIDLPSAKTKYNGPGHETRFDQPATFYEKAIPQHLAHAVFYIQDIEGTPAFYRERLVQIDGCLCGSWMFPALRQINRSPQFIHVSDAGQQRVSSLRL